jgi:hypothetical protein
MGQKKGLFKYHTKEVRNWDREAHQNKPTQLSGIILLNQSYNL